MWVRKHEHHMYACALMSVVVIDSVSHSYVYSLTPVCRRGLVEEGREDRPVTLHLPADQL